MQSYTLKLAHDLAQKLGLILLYHSYSVEEAASVLLKQFCQAWSLDHQRMVIMMARAIVDAEAEHRLERAKNEGITEEEIAFTETCLDISDALEKFDAGLALTQSGRTALPGSIPPDTGSRH